MCSARLHHRATYRDRVCYRAQRIQQGCSLRPVCSRVQGGCAACFADPHVGIVRIGSPANAGSPEAPPRQSRYRCGAPRRFCCSICFRCSVGTSLLWLRRGPQGPGAWRLAAGGCAAAARSPRGRVHRSMPQGLREARAAKRGAPFLNDRSVARSLEYSKGMMWLLGAWHARGSADAVAKRRVGGRVPSSELCTISLKGVSVHMLPARRQGVGKKKKNLITATVEGEERKLNQGDVSVGTESAWGRAKGDRSWERDLSIYCLPVCSCLHHRVAKQHTRKLSSLIWRHELP